jgi:fibro-slime domain-containing protein
MSTGRFRALTAGALLSLLFVTACGSGDAGSGGDDTTTPDAADGADGGRPDAIPRPDAGPPGTPDAEIDTCGDGVRGITEACDDGDAEAGDGCGADCLAIEVGFRCPVAGQDCIANRCDDGRIDSPETCEDGNTTAGDGCSATCTLEPGWTCPLVGVRCSADRCGDTIVAGFEQCDDGDAVGGDGCSATCTLEAGYKCPETGGECTRTRCGDGVTEGTEQCDDNSVPAGTLPPSFDGCDSYCNLEPSCSNGVCTPVCGDGLILPGDGQEPCDDGNPFDGDGCSSTCTIETGYTCPLRPTELPASIPLPVTIRDFKGAGLTNGHPDFEGANVANSNIRFGLVTSTMTAGRPTFNTAHVRDPAKADPTQTSFAQWYAAGALVKTLTREVSLARVGTSDVYTFDSTNQGFFPIDNVGWTDPALPAGDREPLRATDGTVNVPGNHNFNFTTETKFWFQYNGREEVLTFSGDDDLWVFVNGQLCLDVGGLHPRRTAVMNLANPNASEVRDENGNLDNAQTTTQRAVVQACKTALETVRGTRDAVFFEVSIFHAERHTSASNFRLTLNNFIKNSSSCESLCGDGIVASDEVCDLGPGMNNGGYNGCLDCRELGPRCGDENVDAPDETCDDGVNDGGYNQCGPTCHVDEFCGDGVRQPAQEECDDGPNNGTGGCSSTCRRSVD